MSSFRTRLNNKLGYNVREAGLNRLDLIVVEVGTPRRGTVNRGVTTPKLFMNDQRVREYI